MKKNQKQKKPAMYLLLVLSATSFNLYAEHPISVSAVYSYDFMRNTPNAVVLDAATMKPILLQEIAEKALLETFGWIFSKSHRNTNGFFSCKKIFFCIICKLVREKMENSMKQEKQIQNFVIPLLGENILDVLDIVKDHIYFIKHNHLFIFNKKLITKIRKKFPQLLIIQMDVAGEVDNMSVFLQDYFFGGNLLYSRYEIDLDFMVVIPLTNPECTLMSLEGMFGKQEYIVSEGFIFLKNSQKVREFRTIFPYMTQIFIPYNSDVSLQDSLEVFLQNKIFISHRIHHIPDRRGYHPKML